MRILFVGNFGRSWDGSICDESHVANALKELNHEVVMCQRDEVLSHDHNDNDYHFTLVAQWDGYGDLSNLPRPIVYWAFDYQRDGQEWHEKLIDTADLYLSKRVADSRYPNWRWLCQDFAPQFLDRMPSEPFSAGKDIDVLFTGTYIDYAQERNETLKLVDDNFNLTIHSVTPDAFRERGFKNVNNAVVDEGLPALISRAKINLSIDAYVEDGYWSDRNAQIIACGGFVLFRYVPMSEVVFRSDVGYFFSKEDCIEATRYWLEHDEDREVVAEQAYEHSNMYKVRERVADMLNIVRSVF